MVSNESSDLRFTNVNLIGNSVADTGYGYYCWGSRIEYRYARSLSSGSAYTHVNAYNNTSTRWPDIDRTVNNTCERDTFDTAPGVTALISADPMYIDVEAEDSLDWDLHLNVWSPSVDAGKASIADVDDSTNDIGAYGGPEGSGW